MAQARFSRTNLSTFFTQLTPYVATKEVVKNWMPVSSQFLQATIVKTLSNPDDIEVYQNLIAFLAAAPNHTMASIVKKLDLDEIYKQFDRTHIASKFFYLLLAARENDITVSITDEQIGAINAFDKDKISAVPNANSIIAKKELPLSVLMLDEKQVASVFAAIKKVIADQANQDTLHTGTIRAISLLIALKPKLDQQAFEGRLSDIAACTGRIVSGTAKMAILKLIVPCIKNQNNQELWKETSCDIQFALPLHKIIPEKCFFVLKDTLSICTPLERSIILKSITRYLNRIKIDIESETTFSRNQYEEFKNLTCRLSELEEFLTPNIALGLFSMLANKNMNLHLINSVTNTLSTLIAKIDKEEIPDLINAQLATFKKADPSLIEQETALIFISLLVTRLDKELALNLLEKFSLDDSEARIGNDKQKLCFHPNLCGLALSIRYSLAKITNDQKLIDKIITIFADDFIAGRNLHKSASFEKLIPELNATQPSLIFNALVKKIQDTTNPRETLYLFPSALLIFLISHRSSQLTSQQIDLAATAIINQLANQDFFVQGMFDCFTSLAPKLSGTCVNNLFASILIHANSQNANIKITALQFLLALIANPASYSLFRDNIDMIIESLNHPHLTILTQGLRVVSQLIAAANDQGQLLSKQEYLNLVGELFSASTTNTTYCYAGEAFLNTLTVVMKSLAKRENKEELKAKVNAALSELIQKKEKEHVNSPQFVNINKTFTTLKTILNEECVSTVYSFIDINLAKKNTPMIDPACNLISISGDKHVAQINKIIQQCISLLNEKNTFSGTPKLINFINYAISKIKNNQSDVIEDTVDIVLKKINSKNQHERQAAFNLGCTLLIEKKIESVESFNEKLQQQYDAKTATYEFILLQIFTENYLKIETAQQLAKKKTMIASAAAPEIAVISKTVAASEPVVAVSVPEPVCAGEVSSLRRGPM